MAFRDDWLAFAIFSGIWGFVGLVVPCFIPKCESRGVIRCMLMETALFCYLFWLCTWLMQLNPLVGPMLKKATLVVIKQEWGS